MSDARPIRTDIYPSVVGGDRYDARLFGPGGWCTLSVNVSRDHAQQRAEAVAVVVGGIYLGEAKS